jgi:predicted DCC family thiol-disulfide oxidoreductase YuxK
MNISKKNQTKWPAKVFYDGSCPICRREIKYYKNRDEHGRLSLVDITDPSFVAGDFGLDPEAVNRELYVCTADGNVYTAVEGFRKIWQAVGLEPLAMISRLPILSQSMDIGYRLFARYRQQLTVRCSRHSCGEG